MFYLFLCSVLVPSTPMRIYPRNCQSELTSMFLLIREYMLVIKVISITLLVYVLSRAIRGRHRTPISEKKTQTGGNTVVNLHNTTQCDANAPAESNLCDVSNQYRTQTIRMNELRENSSVNTWLVKLDRYLLK